MDSASPCPSGPNDPRDRLLLGGSRPGDRYVRLKHLHGFRRLAHGRYEVRQEAIAPRHGLARLWMLLKRIVVGEPLATAQAASA